MSHKETCRKYFEEIYQKSVTDLVWDNIWRELCRLERRKFIASISKEVVKIAAEWKLRFPRSPFTEKVVSVILEFQEKYQGKTTFEGLEIALIVKEVKSDICLKSFYNCFYRAGLTYSETETYTVEDFKEVLTYALAIVPRSRNAQSSKLFTR